MKKTLLIAAVALMTTASHAQDATRSVSITPKVGVNFANVTKGDGNTRIGLVLGAELECSLTSMVGLSVGALYSQQGCKGDVETEVGNADATMRLDYVNVPILANVYVVKGLAVKLGVQPAFKVNSSVKASVGNTSTTQGMSGVKAVDFSIPVGLSYEYNNVVVDARYNIGCTKIVDYADSKHGVFQLTLGYRFDL